MVNDHKKIVFISTVTPYKVTFVKLNYKMINQGLGDINFLVDRYDPVHFC